MTTTIEAQVWREPYTTPAIWWAEAVAYGSDGVEACRSRAADSWPEAMLLVPVLRAELDRELMDEVHASRARRRTPVVIGPEEEPTA